MLHKGRRGCSGGVSATFSAPAFRETRTGSGTTINFTSVDFGAADPNRVVILAIHKDGSANTITGVTIGGVTASSLVTPPTASTNVSYLYAAKVPSGATGTVTITCSASTTLGFGVFRMVRALGSVTPDHTGTATVTTGNISIAASVESGGAGIAFATDDDANLHTCTNFTEAYDETTGGDWMVGGTFSAAATLTVANSVTNTNDKTMIYASWS